MTDNSESKVLKALVETCNHFPGQTECDWCRKPVANSVAQPPLDISDLPLSDPRVGADYDRAHGHPVQAHKDAEEVDTPILTAEELDELEATARAGRLHYINGLHTKVLKVCAVARRRIEAEVIITDLQAKLRVAKRQIPSLRQGRAYDDR